MRFLSPARLFAAGLIVLAATFTLWVVPSDDYIFLPDPAHPVAPLVEVAGGKEPQDGGGIYFVDVLVRKATMLERLFSGVREEGADVRPPGAVIPHGLSEEEQRQLDLSEMRRSQDVAAAVALRSLGRKVSVVPAGARVAATVPGQPADGKLLPGDVIVAVEGKAVRSRESVTELMATRPVGQIVRFTVRRDKKTKVISLRTIAAPPEPKRRTRAIVGVYLEQETRIKLPVRVTIDAEGVGGPSAGLAFALGVLEELGRDVDGGHKIAVTGAISLDGRVGEIGGIKQKTIGARKAGVDAFLVPAGDNAREARKYADGLRIIPVKSFQQALRSLATLAKSA